MQEINTFVKLSTYQVDFNDTDEDMLETIFSLLYERKKLFSKKKKLHLITSYQQVQR